MQLLDQYCPWAVLMLSMLMPCTDQIGWTKQETGTLLGYDFTPASVVMLIVTGILGRSVLQMQMLNHMHNLHVQVASTHACMQAIECTSCIQ